MRMVGSVPGVDLSLGLLLSECLFMNVRHVSKRTTVERS